MILTSHNDCPHLTVTNIVDKLTETTICLNCSTHRWTRSMNGFYNPTHLRTRPVVAEQLPQFAGEP